MNQSNLLENEDRFPANNDHVPLIIPEQHPNNPNNESETPYSKLFQYATENDKTLMIIGSISSIVKGASIPYILLLVGQIIDVYGKDIPFEKQSQEVTEIANEFYRLGLVNLVASFLAVFCWRKASENQTVEIRKRYLGSLLSQDMPFLDSIGPDKKKDEDIRKIQIGIGEKIPGFLSNLATVLLGIMIAYVQGWKLALSLTGVSMFLFWAVLKLYMFFGLFGKLKQIKDAGDRAEQKPKAIAKEVLHKIRTVISFGGPGSEKIRYKAALEAGREDIARLTKVSVFVQELSSFGVFLMILLSFYLGLIFIVPVKQMKDSPDSYFTGGKMVTVTACIFMVWFSLGQAFTKMESFAVAKGAGGSIFKVIDRNGCIDENRGIRLDNIVGDIEFRNVKFTDPLKAERKMLDGIRFKIRQNEKVALVGDLGCGRGACLDLIQRFYSLSEQGNGSITLDGHEIRDLNMKWMRENIGYIGKEPALFASTIRENLLMGKEDANDAQLLQVLGQVRAFQYIQSLSDNLERVPIGVKYLVNMAQILLKNPRILLIDEPMVDFGEMSEAIQEALKKISEGRTTVICASSLQTMKNVVGEIVVLEKGKIVEKGNFEDLIDKQEILSNLHQLKAEIPSLPSENKRRKHVNVESRFKGEAEKGEFSRRLSKYRGQLPSCLAGLLAFVNGFVLIFMGYTLCKMLEVSFDAKTEYFHHEINSLAQRFLVSTVIYFILKINQNLFLKLLGDDVAEKIKNALFERYLKMPVVWFDKPESSPEELCKTLSKGVSMVRNYVITEAKVAGLVGLFFGVIGVDIINSFEARPYQYSADSKHLPDGIFWWPIGISVFIHAIEYKKAHLYKRFYPKKSLYEGGNYFIGKILKNLKAVTSFTKRDKIIENYSLKLDESLETATLSGTKIGALSGICCFMVLCACAQIFTVGASQNYDYSKNFQSRVLRSFFLAVFIVYAINDCFSLHSKGGESLVVLDILRFLDNNEPQDNVNLIPKRRNGITGNIEFLNVSFRSQDSERLVFQNLSLKIEPWSKVAFVGLSEEEKSVISMLLQGLYDPMQGAIIVNGVSVKDYEARYLRDCIGVLPKDPILFNNTIEYNIKYGQEDEMNYQEKRDIAEKAGALNFIINNNFEFINNEDKDRESYGLGFERLIGSKGGQLSQSQTQRIAMARAIRKNPPVLIVDDVLNGLDTENERLVREPLDSIMEGKTCLIFSNRMSQIKMANEIFVFKEGRLVERGSYDVLAAQQGVFSRLEGNLLLDI